MGKDRTLQREVTRAILICGLVLLVIVFMAELDRFRRIIWGVEENVTYLNRDLEGYLRPEVRKVVKSTASQVVYYPESASLNKQTGELISGQPGQIIGISKTIERIMAASANEEIKPVVYKLEPYVKKEKIEVINRLLGNYSTVVTGGVARVENIKQATRLVNNSLVLPGEIFSFNEAVGPRTKERGFKEAPELEDGELTSGVGGGICQVASTLYNAALESDLKVVERHSHSSEVGYVPEGKDATIAWEILDFKFKNNSSEPIIIKGYLNKGSLTIAILGTKAGKKD